MAVGPSSKSLSRNSNGALLYTFHRPSLGDKLQVLAELAPRYLIVVEMFVDLALKAARNEL